MVAYFHDEKVVSLSKDCIVIDSEQTFKAGSFLGLQINLGNILISDLNEILIVSLTGNVVKADGKRLTIGNLKTDTAASTAIFQAYVTYKDNLKLLDESKARQEKAMKDLTTALEGLSSNLKKLEKIITKGSNPLTEVYSAFIYNGNKTLH